MEIPATPEDNFRLARFSCWHPTAQPKGVITLCPGSNGDGRNWINDGKWRRFAARHQLALVGINLEDKQPSWIEQYIEASKGSGSALLSALDQFGLGDTPIAIYGYSAGGEFAFEFCHWHAPKQPGRIKAFCSAKGGVYASLLASEACRATPAIWFSGTNDAAYRQLSIRAIYELNSVAGCKWQHLTDNRGHSIADSERLSMRLFEEVLNGQLQ